MKYLGSKSNVNDLVDKQYVDNKGLVQLTYGTSTWAEFTDAFDKHQIVYCLNGSRLAFLAYVFTGSSVEFQYYRSLGSPSVTQQPDEVYVYTLKSNNTWTTTTRKASNTITVGNGLTRTYTASSRTLKLDIDTKYLPMAKKLWTNPSPAADFASQDIILSSSTYDMLVWYFRSDTTGNLSFAVTSLKGYGTQFDFFSSASNTRRWCRRITFVNNTTFTAADCLKLEDGTTANDQCVPLYVIGYSTTVFS